MEDLLVSLPVVIYFLLIVLIIVFIVIGIKLIITMNKVDKIVDDVQKKLESLNGLFSIIDFATDRVSSVIDSIVSFITKRISSLFKKKDREEEEYE